MKKVFNKNGIIGLSCLVGFLFLLILLLTVDKKPNLKGQIGLSGLNQFFLVGSYNGSWDGFSDVILYISLGFLVGLAIYGLYQLGSKKSLFKVDKDILLIGGGILIIIVFWILFDKGFVVNYRPAAAGMEDPSFPSTHVMLTTFILLSSGYSITKRNAKKPLHKILSYVGLGTLVLLCALGRILSSMHWMTDVLGGFLIGFGLYSLVVGLDKAFSKPKNDKESV